jgi:hypothetical protein
MILLAACVREAHVTGAPDAAPFTLASNPQAVMPIKQAFAKSKPRWTCCRCGTRAIGLSTSNRREIRRRRLCGLNRSDNHPAVRSQHTATRGI